MDNNIKNLESTRSTGYDQINEPDVLGMAYDNQTKALEIRAQEINLEKQEEEHSFQIQ